jgi:threonine dehydrogenase-like Zn-dependent dehydrogenase
MKALVQTAPQALDFRDAPDPEVAPGQSRVRIAASGICGSDMHAFLGHDPRRPVPLILGHEAAGRLDDGTAVTINPLMACGTCAACVAGRDNLCPERQIISMPPREGAFAEFVAMPEANLIPLPDTLPADKAALAEPLACGWHAVRLGLDLVPDAAAALVIGGGAIGLGAALSLAAQGVAGIVQTEPNPLRRDYLAARAPHDVRAPDDLHDAAFELVVDGVGLDATRAEACARVRPGGAILHIGLGGGVGGLDIRRMTLQEIAFVGTYTYTAADFRATVAAMADGRLGPLDWIEVRPLADGARAFADIREGRVAAPKIILHP